jgi:peptide/nickel transport system permease protein
MRHLFRRLGFYLMALWASATINFIIPRLMPGDPVQAYLSQLGGKQNVPPEMMSALRAQFGVSDAPIWVQYFEYLGNLLRGNLGVSVSQYPARVTDLLARDVPWTLGMVGLAAVISFLLGTLIGVIVSWRRGGWLDSVAAPLLTFFSAIPYFWMALGLVYLCGFVWSLFPIGGGYDALGGVVPGFSLDFILSVIRYGTLPAFTIVISTIAGWVLGMRNAMVTTLSEDYVLMARAKGLHENRVMFAYAARNAILPSITGFAMSLGFVVGGALVTEIVFAYPGIGYALLNAVVRKDYNLIEGIFLMIAIAMLVANFLAEMIYTVLDPRVRQERG